MCVNYSLSMYCLTLSLGLERYSQAICQTSKSGFGLRDETRYAEDQARQRNVTCATSGPANRCSHLPAGRFVESNAALWLGL